MKMMKRVSIAMAIAMPTGRRELASCSWKMPIASVGKVVSNGVVVAIVT